MNFDPYRLARPLLFALPPERAHQLSIAALKAGRAPNAVLDPPTLATTLAGLSLPNPIGLAAGFDKNAEVFSALLDLGFGFVEVGTLTPRAQPGNPPPRIVRLREDGALINRLGFNNAGQAGALGRLQGPRPGIVGINIGANKSSADRIADYTEGARRMAPVADYLTVNISSPNTPGLRSLQAATALEELLGRIADALPPQPPPLFIKIAPDLSEAEVEAVFQVAARASAAAIIATNTTVARPPALASPHRGFEGGLSGPPLAPAATHVLRQLHALRRATPGSLALIGVGGIACGADAYARIRAGADAVQLYTALVYHGPGLIARIKRDLARLLARDGFGSVADAVGVDA